MRFWKLPHVRLLHSSPLLNRNQRNPSPTPRRNPLLSRNPRARLRHERHIGEPASKNRRRGGSRRCCSFDEGAGGIQHWTIRESSAIARRLLSHRGTRI